MVLRNLENCKDTVKRITKIISGLRNLSHSNAGELTETSIKDLIEDSIIVANLKISGKGIELKIDLTETENELIVCNAIQISQVLVNLLANSIYEVETKEKPWVSLKIENTDLGFKFTIMDSGSGIPADVQKKMFEPMYTTKPIGKGTGLGLSISRSIIEQHQGTLTINNNSPNTCFEIILPKTLAVKIAA